MATFNSDQGTAAAQLRAIVEQGERACGLDLRGADLTGVNLSKLSADRLDWREALLRRATLRAARFGACRFDAAHFEEADLSRATLRTCVLDGAHGAGARFDGARIEDSTAIGIDLSSASLRGAHLSETSFARAVLRMAVCDTAEGDGVEFRGADLTGATLIGARLDEADFRGADLRGADLSRGRFRDADFRGALLDGARFDRADCAGALFDGDAPPRADAGRQTAPGTGAKPFDEVALTGLRELMAALPGALAAREGPAADFVGRLQQVNLALGEAATERPEEWKPWVEQALKVLREEPADVNAMLSAVADGPIKLEGADAIANRLREVFQALDAATDQPPEEWKHCLELFMKMTSGERPMDPAALIDALASAAARVPSPRPK